MAYKSSPRPTFRGPAHIPYASVTRHLWGDPEAGLVDDWIYVSSDKIHQLVFGMPPGDGFRHSEAYRTVFAADEVLIVLQGTMVIANPETGEVLKAQPGEAVFFRKDTWHHAFAFGSEALRVLEFFAPPPATGTSGKYAQTRPYLTTPRYERAELLGAWPAGRASARSTLHLLRDADLLWSLDAQDKRVLTGIFASTEHLTSGRMEIAPGGKSASRRHGGAAGFYVTRGRLNVLIEDPLPEGPVWFELAEGDGFYMPEATRYRLMNMSGAPAALLFGVAPSFAAPDI